MSEAEGRGGGAGTRVLHVAVGDDRRSHVSDGAARSARGDDLDLQSQRSGVREVAVLPKPLGTVSGASSSSPVTASALMHAYGRHFRSETLATRCGVQPWLALQLDPSRALPDRSPARS